MLEATSALRRHAPALLLASSVMFAVMATATAGLRGRVPAVELVASRSLFGLIALTVYFIARRRGPDLTRAPQLLMRGTFGTAAVFCYFYAIEHIGAGPATMLNFISPCYAAIFAPFFLKERSSPKVLVGLAIATVGACLVAYGSSHGAGSDGKLGWGAIAGLAAGVLGGASTTTNRALRSTTDAATIFFAFCSIGFLCTAPFSATIYVPIGPADWLLVFLVGMASVGGQLFYSQALGYTEAVLAGVMNQLVPVFTFVLAVVFLGERPTWLTITGAALCLLGVLSGLLPKRRVPAAAVIQRPT